MSRDELIALLLERVPSEYPKNMLCCFANNLAQGRELAFTHDLLDALEIVENVVPGYADEMLSRIGSIAGVGEQQYDSVLQILGEIYVTSGLVSAADVEAGIVQFRHEPRQGQGKNPEFEVRVSNHWLAVEVKTPRLIQFGRIRTSNDFQLTARLPNGLPGVANPTLPRDNPVKDFLVSAEEKFIAHERVRKECHRILVIIWDDFSNEPISALIAPGSGLLTENSFYKDKSGAAVKFPHVDGVLIIRHQHQLIRATRCEPLIDGVAGAFAYKHDGFPPKAYIRAPAGAEPPIEIMEALNATPLENCAGAEYQPSELIMWVGNRDSG